MDWPNDADGDVFRRLADDRFDFSTAHVVDFVIDFSDSPPAEAVARLRQTYPTATLCDHTEYGPKSLLFQIQAVVTYELVTATQEALTKLLRPFGGVCNSWGVLNEASSTRPESSRTSVVGVVLKTGSWIYDGVVVGRVRILRMKAEHSNIADLDEDDDEQEEPPTDVEGYFYVAEFSLLALGPSNSGSRSWGHATVEEAIRYAEEKLPSPISWDR